MATKKQKRQAALEKRERFMESLRISNLQNLRKAREHRVQEDRELWQKQHDKKHNWKNRLHECPHCSDILREQKNQAAS